MPIGVGFGALGKKQNTNATDKNAIAMPLTTMPARPRSKREGRRGSPRSRLANMQPMTTR
jgi:hypothetical protein